MPNGIDVRRESQKFCYNKVPPLVMRSVVDPTQHMGNYAKFDQCSSIGRCGDLLEKLDT